MFTKFKTQKFNSILSFDFLDECEENKVLVDSDKVSDLIADRVIDKIKEQLVLS
ncbi:hypothetical protein [Nonlabens marinus]|uniref:Uncharacterized protein n=1 Tax=Nonlabens marinus S1-08 TaxID=1454201 RepID=W8VUU5_9FLAO|nr:hypothetical protein [Nonlabens marinus]BAO54903.1 hypothetical protein NMS_0894 [Nonlabens marinus S1-08]